MKKKIYNQPSMKVIELEATDILAGSNDPSSLSIFDETVEPSSDPDAEEKGWGKQW